MGGAIAVTLRLRDGTEFRSCRHTRDLDRLVRNVDLLEGNQRYLDTWGKPLDSVLCPDGYGLIVLDLMGGVILSMQNYMDLSEIYSVGVWNDADGLVDDGAAERYRALYEAGRITRYQQGDSEGELEVGASPMEALAAVTPMTGRGIRKRAFLKIDTSPLEVENFNSDPGGIRAMRERIEGLFVLSDAERASWDEFLQDSIEMWGDDDEDE